MVPPLCNEDPGFREEEGAALAAAFLSLRRYDPDQVRRVSAPHPTRSRHNRRRLGGGKPAASQPPDGAPLGQAIIRRVSARRQGCGLMTQTESSGKPVVPMSQQVKLAPKEHWEHTMIVWRVIGWILLLAGLSVLVRDVIASFDTGVWRPIAVGQLWYDFDRSSLNLVQAVIQRYVSPFLWNQDCRSCAAVLGVCRADRLGCLCSCAQPDHGACGIPDHKTGRE